MWYSYCVRLGKIGASLFNRQAAYRLCVVRGFYLALRFLMSERTSVCSSSVDFPAIIAWIRDSVSFDTHPTARPPKDTGGTNSPSDIRE
jgi:hypothetical protein